MSETPMLNNSAILAGDSPSSFMRIISDFCSLESLCVRLSGF